MIIEGLLTTCDFQGQPHVAPMGPVVDEKLEHWRLRPFQSSSTFENLRRYPYAVFHVVDDVLSLAQTALGLESDLQFAKVDNCWILPSACHWYRLQVTEWDLSESRSGAEAIVLEQRIQRPFWGWNRAKHAIIEATILLTRRHLLERSFIEQELGRLESAVEKTAGTRERQAWELLRQQVKEGR